MFGRQQRKKALQSEPVASLAAQVSQLVRAAQWQGLPAGAEIIRTERWTERQLLDALEALLQALVADDESKERSGRDSSYFEFYDNGLAAMCEALRDRLGIPQPWEEKRGKPPDRGPYR
jgi:hypothetical protein